MFSRGGAQVTDHYYSQTPSSAREPRTFRVKVRGQEVSLKSDAGVFSKAGLDFGTRVLIEAVTLPERGIIIDLGSGYGPVAAILARVYLETSWWLLDVNPRAVELARENTAFAADRTHVIQSDGFAAVPDMVADAVLLNPPIRAGKKVVYSLFEQSRDHLVSGGCLWIVIQKKQGAPSAKERLEQLFSNVETVERDAGYHIIRACK